MQPRVQVHVAAEQLRAGRSGRSTYPVCVSTVEKDKHTETWTPIHQEYVSWKTANAIYPSTVCIFCGSENSKGYYGVEYKARVNTFFYTFWNRDIIYFTQTIRMIQNAYWFKDEAQSRKKKEKKRNPKEMNLADAFIIRWLSYVRTRKKTHARLRIPLSRTRFREHTYAWRARVGTLRQQGLDSGFLCNNTVFTNARVRALLHSVPRK